MLFCKTIGLIGDVHQQVRALEAALRYLSGLPLDRILCTGDVADGFGNFERCCALLREQNVETVCGNHDRWLVKGTMRDMPDALPSDALADPERGYLRSLPATREINTVAGMVLLCHGMGDNDMGSLLPWDEGYALESNSELQRIISSARWRIVVAGHTHRRLVRHFGNIHFINPGTLLQLDSAPTFAVLDVESQAVRFFELRGTEPTEVEVVALRI